MATLHNSSIMRSSCYRLRASIVRTRRGSVPVIDTWYFGVSSLDCTSLGLSELQTLKLSFPTNASLQIRAIRTGASNNGHLNPTVAAAKAYCAACTITKADLRPAVANASRTITKRPADCAEIFNPVQKQAFATLLLHQQEVSECVLVKYAHMEGVEDADFYTAPLHHRNKSTIQGTSNSTPLRTFTGLQMLNGDMLALQVCMHVHMICTRCHPICECAIIRMHTRNCCCCLAPSLSALSLTTPSLMATELL